MTWAVLFPAIAVVLALISLSLGLRQVGRELMSLRVSLRRTAATAVAADELRRTTAAVAARAVAVEADGRRRVHRPRGQRPLDAR